MKTKIRKATLRDIPQIIETENSSSYSNKKIPFRQYIVSLFQKKAIIICAEIKEKIIGYVTLSKNGTIDFLAVTKKQRRKGIATLLMSKIIKEAKKIKLKKIALEVKNTNHKAINLYKKFEFKKIKSVKKKYNKNIIIKLKMIKKLK